DYNTVLLGKLRPAPRVTLIISMHCGGISGQLHWIRGAAPKPVWRAARERRAPAWQPHRPGAASTGRLDPARRAPPGASTGAAWAACPGLARAPPAAPTPPAARRRPIAAG